MKKRPEKDKTLFFCFSSLAVAVECHGERAGAARRRWERRLPSFWRHEQMAVQMVLATVTHHSFGKVGTAGGFLRNQRTTRTGKGEEYDTHCSVDTRQQLPDSASS